MENIDRHAASQPDNVLGNITRSFITVHFSGEVLGLQDFVIYQRSFVPHPSSFPSPRHWKLQYKSPSQDDTDRDIFVRITSLIIKHSIPGNLLPSINRAYASKSENCFVPSIRHQSSSREFSFGTPSSINLHYRCCYLIADKIHT